MKGKAKKMMLKKLLEDMFEDEYKGMGKDLEGMKVVATAKDPKEMIEALDKTKEFLQDKFTKDFLNRDKDEDDMEAEDGGKAKKKMKSYECGGMAKK